MDDHLDIVFLGDLCLSGGIQEHLASAPSQNLLDPISRWAPQSAYLVANLECAISERGKPRPLRWTALRADPSSLDSLVGLDVAVLANNHIDDYGDIAALDTIKHLEQRGIRHVGYGSDLAESLRPCIVQAGNIRCGILAFSCASTNGGPFATTESPGVAPLSMALVKESLLSIRSLVDVVVVYIHWGLENSRGVVEDQARVARRVIEWGATVIIGCHGHVIQPYEEIAGRYVFYGLGNLVFADTSWQAISADGTIQHHPIAQQSQNRESLAVHLLIRKAGGSLSTSLVRVQPFRFDSSDFIPRPVEDHSLTTSIRVLNKNYRQALWWHGPFLSGENEITYSGVFAGLQFGLHYTTAVISHVTMKIRGRMIREYIRQMSKTIYVHFRQRLRPIVRFFRTLIQQHSRIP